MIKAVHHKIRYHAPRLWDFIGASLMDQMLVSGVSFVIGLYLAKVLGIVQFGQFSLILLITYLCLEAQRALIIAPMMTFSAIDENEHYLPQLGYMQILFNLTVSLLSAGFVFLTQFYFPKWQIGEFAGVTGFMVFSRMQQEFLRRIFFVQGRPIRAMALDVITFTTLLVTITLLTITDRLSLRNVFWWHVAAYLCPSFLSMIYLLQENVAIRAWREIYLKHLAFGRWLIGGAVVQFFSSNWLLMSGGAVLGAHAVGLIKSAQYLLGGVTMLFQALENVVPFKLARYYQKNDRVGRHDYLFKMSVFLFFFIILYVGLMLYLTPFFAHYLRIGNNDTASFIAVARLLLVQSVLYGPILMLTYMLRAQKLTRPIFLTHAVTAVVTVLAGPIIIPIWHEMAIVYGLGAIQVAVMIFFSIFVYRASKRDT